MAAASLLAQRLGLARAVIPHVDDLGMCHGANRAFLDFARRGLVTCGSVMVPCPWFHEIAEAGAVDPSLDLGVHLTLTSEWEHYRWRPVSAVSRASGLIDPDGYFWRDVASLRRLRLRQESVLAARHPCGHNFANPLPGMVGVRKNNHAPAFLRQCDFLEHSFADRRTSGLDGIRLYGALNGHGVVSTLHHDDLFDHEFVFLPVLACLHQNNKKKRIISSSSNPLSYSSS